MIDRRSRTGVNPIATVLLVVSIMLIIGFSIGALGTINLNIAGRSVNVIKANQLAEAAVSRFIYDLDEKALVTNQSVRLDNLTCPVLKLDEYYDGNRNIFGSVPRSKLGENCSCDIHFVKTGGYYSTDNSYNNVAADGAWGQIPPFTIDLIMTVNIGNFTKHYQVWIKREWDYVIYSEKAPVHLVSAVNYNPTANTLMECNPCSVKGNIYCGFDASQLTFPTPGFSFMVLSSERIQTVIANMVVNKKFNELVVNNTVPNSNHSSSVFIGGHVISRWLIENGNAPPEETTGTQCLTTGSSIKGKIVYGHQGTSASPSLDHFEYPNNDNSTIEGNITGRPVGSPFNSLALVDDSDATSIVDRPGSPIVVKADYTGGLFAGSNQMFSAETAPYWLDQGPLAGDQQKLDIITFQQQEYAQDSAAARRTVFLLTRSLKVNPSSTAGHDMQWGKDEKFVVKGGGAYLPLVDGIRIHEVGELITTKSNQEIIIDNSTDPPLTRTQVIEKRFFTVSDQECAIDPHDNTFNFDHSLLIAKNNIELCNSKIVGDDCLLQVEGDVNLRAGHITAGQDVGTAIYCRNFNCLCDGSINGIIFAKERMIGGNCSGISKFKLNGGIVVQGVVPPVGSVTEFKGLTCMGFELTYDPAFMNFLNRFGQFRVACWKLLD
jgi:hypothetical protein